MKKILISLAGIAVLATATLLFVDATGNKKEKAGIKKEKTELKNSNECSGTCTSPKEAGAGSCCSAKGGEMKCSGEKGNGCCSKEGSSCENKGTKESTQSCNGKAGSKETGCSSSGNQSSCNAACEHLKK